MPLLLLFVGLLAATLGVRAQQPPAAVPPAAAPPAASALDFEVFKTRVQPIFLAKRPGHARCITCHANGTPRLQPLADGQATWTDAQSRQNFEAWQRVVAPGDPDASRLLAHPLAKQAGGDPFHAGGKHWTSKTDPEYQLIADWIRAAKPPTLSAGAGGLDFEVYRTRIEPIFVKERAANEGAGRCVDCHSRISTRLRLQPLENGQRAWTEAQSRQNFEAVKRVVVAGDPSKSPLAIHPLAPSAGGDPQHTGGKFWTSQDNPEYQAVVAWVRSARASGDADAKRTPALDFEFFRQRVEPIFLAKRPGHARCITCHRNGQPRLIELADGQATWTEAQSRQNFEAWQRVVAPGDPEASRLLMHPLAKEAGGDHFHAGGKHWTSKTDPEWQILAGWVRGDTLTRSSR